MKQGCLILLVVVVLVFWGYQHLLEGSEFSSTWGIPLGFGILAAMLAGNAQGILQAYRHISASKKNQSQWRDNDLVVLSGRLQAQKTALEAPISGKSATIVEYEVRRYYQTSNTAKNSSETRSNVEYRGCLMTPCNIQSTSGQVGIVGFPILTNWTGETYEDIESFKRLAKYLMGNATSIMPKNPIAAIAELNKILKDDDGEVKANYRENGAIDIQDYTNEILSRAKLPEDQTDELDTDLNLEEEEAEEADIEDLKCQAELANLRNSEDPIENIVYLLKDKGYSLFETCVPNGAEVTIMGTYIANKRQVDIGSGLSKIDHGIHRGSASQVLGKNLSKALILTSIFAAIFLGANYFLLKKIGIEPEKLFEQLQTWGSGEI